MKLMVTALSQASTGCTAADDDGGRQGQSEETT